MAIFVWLSLIDAMISFDTHQDFHESYAYRQIMHGNPEYEVKVEKNTKQWRE